MSLKAGLLLITLLVGSYALELDLSIFFDYKQAQGRIIERTIVSERIPHMVALVIKQRTRSLFCGGSLITKRHVLTAAHCIRAVYNNGKLLDTIRGIVGTNRYDTGGTEYGFSRNISHPHYVKNTIKNDIGILVTSSDVVMSNIVQCVVVNYDFVGAGVATVDNGWGRTYYGGQASRDLLRHYATVVDGESCRDEIKRRANTSIIQIEPLIEICTFNSTRRGVCIGDSGSPLMRSDLNQQIGVGSWDLLCGSGLPNVFARISAYSEWIKQSIDSWNLQDMLPTTDSSIINVSVYV